MLARRRVPAAFAAAGALAFASSVFACGGDPLPSGDTDPDASAGSDSGLPETAPALPSSTCEKDADCTGAKSGKCLPVGGGQKACVDAKSCTGGAGANSKCGGTPNDDKSEGTSDCCQTVAVPGGTFDAWLASQGKLGGQHKVPRLLNSREVLEAVLAKAVELA